MDILFITLNAVSSNTKFVEYMVTRDLIHILLDSFILPNQQFVTTHSTHARVKMPCGHAFISVMPKM
jgi:hypothetical protein